MAAADLRGGGRGVRTYYIILCVRRSAKTARVLLIKATVEFGGRPVGEGGEKETTYNAPPAKTTGKGDDDDVDGGGERTNILIGGRAHYAYTLSPHSLFDHLSFFFFPHPASRPAVAGSLARPYDDRPREQKKKKLSSRKIIRFNNNIIQFYI